jgi:hypothetical protein
MVGEKHVHEVINTIKPTDVSFGIVKRVGARTAVLNTFPAKCSRGLCLPPIVLVLEFLRHGECSRLAPSFTAFFSAQRF